MKKVYWLGEPYEEGLDEEHGRPLSPLLAGALKGRQLGFVFVLGTQTGRERLSTELARDALVATVYVHKDESVLPKAFGDNCVRYKTKGVAERFEARCREIGEQLLRHQYTGRWDEKKIKGRAMGYGNNTYLVAFPYNVPTASLTLLWSDGRVDGYDWMPLLPRRKKT